MVHALISCRRNTNSIKLWWIWLGVSAEVPSLLWGQHWEYKVGSEDRDQGLQLKKRYSSWEKNGKAGLSISDIIVEMVKNDQKYLTNYCLGIDFYNLFSQAQFQLTVPAISFPALAVPRGYHLPGHSLLQSDDSTQSNASEEEMGNTCWAQ